MNWSYLSVILAGQNFSTRSCPPWPSVSRSCTWHSTRHGHAVTKLKVLVGLLYGNEVSFVGIHCVAQCQRCIHEQFLNGLMETKENSQYSFGGRKFDSLRVWTIYTDYRTVWRIVIQSFGFNVLNHFIVFGIYGEIKYVDLELFNTTD